MLAETLGCAFLDADSLHPEANIEKMRHGIPLADEDRRPWLAAVHAGIRESFGRAQDLVVACSALKEQYRAVLADGVPITWIYLKGPETLFRSRLRDREGHFVPVALLDSQFGALEEPSGAIVVDAAMPVAEIVRHILPRLSANT
jgi:gluconokinase